MNSSRKKLRPGSNVNPIARRAFLVDSFAIATFPLGLSIFGVRPSIAQSTRHYSPRAIDLVRSAQAVDLKHALSLNPAVLKSWLTNSDAFLEADKAAFRSSGLRLIQTTLETDANPLVDFAWHDGFVASHSDFFARIDQMSDFERIANTDKIGIIFGCENSDHFKTLDDVNLYYSLGQRVSQLTYNSQNRLGAGATEREDGGLSDYGLTIVERMNKVGMAIDLSHCGDKTTLDAIAFSTKPCLFTHAAARALNVSHPRTKTDEAIRNLASKGGVMAIPFLRVFARDREPTTIEHVLDHFDHVVKLVGADHVAVGSDISLYGYDSLPRSVVGASKASLKPGSYAFRERDDIELLNHPQRLYDLTEGFIRRGYSNEVIMQILGRNARRALTQIWGS